MSFEKNPNGAPQSSFDLSLPPMESPLWPTNLIGLFFHPQNFFSSKLALGKYPYLVFVTWCYGITYAIGRIDNELIKAELGHPRASFEKIVPLITGSWLGFWGWVLILGAISGLLLWAIGGWWYRVRLQWSGAVNPDATLSRLLYIYASFIYAGPFVILALVQTFVYDNYAQAFAAEEYWSSAFLIFPFWSIITSYLGVKTLFKTDLWKACIWFLILPFLMYIFAFGVIAIAFAFLNK